MAFNGSMEEIYIDDANGGNTDVVETDVNDVEERNEIA